MSRRRLTNDDWVEITGGIQAGEDVVLDPREELQDGMKVSVRPQKEK